MKRMLSVLVCCLVVSGCADMESAFEVDNVSNKDLKHRYRLKYGTTRLRFNVKPEIKGGCIYATDSNDLISKVVVCGNFELTEFRFGEVTSNERK